jgi:predicted CXXCH cytochrome family protein
MKQRLSTIVAVALLAAGSFPAFAADVVKFEAKNGTVTFNHKAHQQRVKGDCSRCHQGTPAKIEIKKDVAHSLCTGCHREMNGPTKCGDCHKK